MNAQKSFKHVFGFWLIFKYPLSMWCNYNWLKNFGNHFCLWCKVFCIHHLMNEPINWILWWKWHFNIFESFLCSFLRADIYFLKNCFHWSNYFFIILVLHDENKRLKSVKYCFIDSHWNCISHGHMWYQVCPL